MARVAGAGHVAARVAAAATIAGCVLLAALPVAAQTMPLLDTDDSSLGQTAAGAGRIHPFLQIGVGNGDYSRGSYDGDATRLNRLPFQTNVALAAELAHGGDGAPTLWLEGVSVNNFHAPHDGEPASPRGWYDNNNLLGLVAQLTPGLRGAVTYVVKTTPNGFATTTHEANVTLAYAGDGILGTLKPGATVTVHPEGGTGVYAQLDIAPAWHLTRADGGPTLSFPVNVGRGFSDFYGAATGAASYASVGISYLHPVRLGRAKAAFHLDASALIRDDDVAGLGDGEAQHATVLPLVSIGFSVAD